MRSFAAVPPTVWQTDIKKLRGDPVAIAVLYHLTTSPHSTMIGLYPLAIAYLAIDLGIPLEGASEGLRRVVEGGICSYDEESEIVWIHDMAASQVAPRLSPKDNRVLAVAKQLALLPICQITLSFYRKYRDTFHLRDALILEDFERAFASPSEAPSEPLRSKDKDKNQDQDLGEGKGKFGSEEEELSSKPERDNEPELPYDPPVSIEAGRSFLVDVGLPSEFMEPALQRLMRSALFPCDVEDWKRQARERRGAA